MRVLLDSDPFLDLTKLSKDPQKFWQRGRWPAKWITHPQADGSAPVVMAFRRTFLLDQQTTIRLHLSADERYELWLDSVRVGRGPERGDRYNWFFESYDLALSAGSHTLVARTWWLNDFGPPPGYAPLAQSSIRPGFVVAADGDAHDLLSTGASRWECKLISGCRFIPQTMAGFTGAKLHVVGSEFSWNWETGQGDGWIAPKEIEFAFGARHLVNQPKLWVLKPATLPPMLDREIHIGTARHVQALNEIPTDELPVHAADHLADEAVSWNNLLQRQQPLTIPPRTTRRVIIDLENYFTAYTDVITTGGRGAVIRSWWAESLYETQSTVSAYGTARIKGNRDEIEGKNFIGIGDTFEPDGGAHRAFSTLWWEAGRYLEIIVKTADEPLTIVGFSFRETRYPHEWISRFEASDPRLAEVIPIARRTLEMCSHETYMDCPYYEQLMYVGDTRLEVLTTYVSSSDDRLPRKALRLFDESRKSPGFNQSRYPSRLEQTIAPFSAWWIGMLHDYMMWRADRSFVAALMPGVRSILDAFSQWKNTDGLVSGPPGWNFIDWVEGWFNGMPVDAKDSVSAVLNLKLAWISQQAAELEDYAGEPELAARFRRHASEFAGACDAAFWDESRGLYADDLAKTQFSEHAQCLALLGDRVPAARRDRVINGLLTAPDLARTTIYFSHYLFEVFARVGRTDKLIDRMSVWFDLTKMGSKTTVEHPEPARSDCHAWGAHPVYHYYATILGIRPIAPEFASVAIRPQLGPLMWARGSMAHHRGKISVSVSKTVDQLTGNVRLPPGVNGILYVNRSEIPLSAGLNKF